jgi:chaperone required for assembly of F1-ATPase
MKRFYSKVAAEPQEGGWQVTLDGRGIKTVGRRPQIVPTAALAEALAQEWERQGERIDPGDFPLRDMADYAIDVVAGDRQAVAHKLVAYADTDTLLYRADPDEPLYARQCELWEPILTAFEAREGITLRRISGIVHAPQDEAALAMLRERVAALDPFTLAALEAMTSLAASLCTGLSALEPEADGRALWQAASLEEEWQAQLWGRDAEAEARRERREADFLRGAEFARLAQA